MLTCHEPTGTNPFWSSTQRTCIKKGIELWPKFIRLNTSHALQTSKMELICIVCRFPSIYIIAFNLLVNQVQRHSFITRYTSSFSQYPRFIFTLTFTPMTATKLSLVKTWQPRFYKKDQLYYIQQCDEIQFFFLRF